MLLQSFKMLGNLAFVRVRGKGRQVRKVELKVDKLGR